MSKTGLKISDGEEYITVKIKNILEEIPYGSSLNWAILDLDGIGPIGNDLSTPDFIEEISDAKDGVPITWNDLNTIFNDMCIFDITVIASSKESNFHHFKNDLEMQQTCEIVIHFFDSSWWEVFSKDSNLIDKLAKKFQKVEFLN